jgi:hypothetical protein
MDPEYCVIIECEVIKYQYFLPCKHRSKVLINVMSLKVDTLFQNVNRKFYYKPIVLLSV